MREFIRKVLTGRHRLSRFRAVLAAAAGDAVSACGIFGTSAHEASLHLADVIALFTTGQLARCNANKDEREIRGVPYYVTETTFEDFCAKVDKQMKIVGLDELRRLRMQIEREYILASKHLQESTEQEDAHPANGGQKRTKADLMEAPVHADVRRGIIRVNGIDYPALPHRCEIIQKLVEAGGHFVTGPQMNLLAGCKGKRICKEIKAIRESIPALNDRIESAVRKGFRLILKE